ncbi:MAG: CHASE3 domain-containing protein, partial [Rhodopila sp.]
MSKHIVARANMLVFAILIGFLALIGGLVWDGLNSTRTARQWSLHTYEVMGALRNLGITLRDAETGERGYLLTGEADYLSPYQSALGRIALLQGDLQHLTADNPAQQARLRSLAPIVQRRLEQLAQTIQVRHDSGLGAAINQIRSSAARDTMQAIEDGLSAMMTEENALLSDRLTDVDAHANWVRRLVLAGAALAILALLWAARMLNNAWSRSASAESTQRALAGELRASLDSL